MKRIKLLIILLCLFQISYFYKINTGLFASSLKDPHLKFTFDQSNGGHTWYVNCLALLENDYLASGSNDYKVKIWDVLTGKLNFTFDRSIWWSYQLGYIISITRKWIFSEWVE
jgi:WD40 repeat protein